jgi:predicted peroxiredoxin
MTAGTRWVLLLESDDAGRLSEAAAMAASAASLGTDITLVWLSGALEALVSGRLDEDPDEPRTASRLLAEARDTGRVQALACSAAVVESGATPEALRGSVDEIVGWPTIVSLLKSAEKTFVW